MNKRVKKLWLRALRSGEYKQTMGQLCREAYGVKRHCCLGVLEEVAIQEGVISGYRHYEAELDAKVQQWAGLDAADPQLGPRSDSPTASGINDKGESFAYIADRIEEYL